ncbi:MAG: ArsA family ATPase [Cellulosilyticum sp.]|nr:ArsA family ATPase [Cellulosilyticum sp.]
MRIILYTGKGGVGKTSIAAATAAKVAGDGKKVLIMSTDQAHSLSDSFGMKLDKKPTYIEENLYGMELDTVEENEKVCGKVMKYIKALMLLKQEDSIEVEELLVFPGLEEMLALLKIKEIYDEDAYDVLIVDCAPTGETMSLLKFPDLFRWWMEKFFPMKKKGAKIAKPIVEGAMKIPMPDDDFFNQFEGLYERVAQLQKLIQNKDIVSLRIVTTPEKIVIKEAQRSFSYLHLYDYNVDAIVINRIFPEQSMTGYFSKWQELQLEAIKKVEECFKGIPIFKQELESTELKGYQMLYKVGDKIFGSQKADDIFFREKVYEVSKDKENYILTIHMPFVDKKELGLSQKGDELTLTIKNEKRSFVLSNKLRSKEISGAQYKDDYLEIYFK